MSSYIEYTLSWLFANAKGRDAKLFSKSPAFSQFPKPTLNLECQEVGSSGSNLDVEHSADGVGRFPTLNWPTASPEIKQYLLINEDPDAPLPNPIIHGIYYGIPASVTTISAEDIEPTTEDGVLKGGFRYGKNRRGNVYIPPRPLLGHGPHRYFFTLVALTEPVDPARLSAYPTVDEMAREIDGKVAAWGEWVGVYERKWK
ncbi:uncharacterized protein N7511_008157 [Penicillium nucicola]|uniref:uncharacterized protein n=1 Tax=Penicillium nucicola TaxID=1850975 RepID=UPI002544DCBC|nr:uncharacterized protein N7511_008157 [Penicillium nucicola]KAJ5754004.1 hypothetical protein N7511_008157 [Penicillium nucicola]